MFRFVVLSVFLLKSSTSGCGISFAPDQDTLALTPGQNVSVLCDSRCLAPEGAQNVTWSRDTLTRVDKRRLYSVSSPQNLVSQLTFQDADHDMAGTYSCYVLFNNRKLQKRSLDVTFHGMTIDRAKRVKRAFDRRIGITDCFFYGHRHHFWSNYWSMLSKKHQGFRGSRTGHEEQTTSQVTKAVEKVNEQTSSSASTETAERTTSPLPKTGDEDDPQVKGQHDGESPGETVLEPDSNVNVHLPDVASSVGEEANSSNAIGEQHMQRIVERLKTSSGNEKVDVGEDITRGNDSDTVSIASLNHKMTEKYTGMTNDRAKRGKRAFDRRTTPRGCWGSGHDLRSDHWSDHWKIWFKNPQGFIGSGTGHKELTTSHVTKKEEKVNEQTSRHASPETTERTTRDKEVNEQTSSRASTETTERTTSPLPKTSDDDDPQVKGQYDGESSRETVLEPDSNVNVHLPRVASSVGEEANSSNAIGEQHTQRTVERLKSSSGNEKVDVDEDITIGNDSGNDYTLALNHIMTENNIAHSVSLDTSRICDAVEQCMDSKEFLKKVSAIVKRVIKLQREIEDNYFVSDDYIGNRYYLQKTQIENFNPTSAEETCENLGGHLAEMDNATELHFVRKFVKEHSINCVFISGSNENNEGSWMNPFNDTPLRYLAWGEGEPNKGRHEKCLALWRTKDYLMVDAPCNGVYAGSILCEVPQ